MRFYTNNIERLYHFGWRQRIRHRDDGAGDEVQMCLAMFGLTKALLVVCIILGQIVLRIYTETVEH